MGFGVYQIADLKECEKCVNAIEVGDRSIDTAQAYGNEEAVGRAVKKSGILGRSSSLLQTFAFQMLGAA